MNERISHATTRKEEYYVIRFDDKEFKVKVIDCQRHHKDYPEIQEVEITQIPSFEDNNKCHEILDKELKR
jgi:ribosomal 50S subunit-recycling heat shock protein